MGTSTQGVGLRGTGGGNSVGVEGVGTAGAGVSGTSTDGAGVSGESTKGAGVTGKGGGAGAGVQGTGTSGPGVSGTSTDGAGVSGTGGETSTGVVGTGKGGAGISGISTTGVGVLAASDEGAGVSASSKQGTGVSGTSESGVGVTGTGGGENPGVLGSSSDNPGVKGKGGGEHAGVEGTCTFGPGVYGNSPQGYGVKAEGATGLYAKGTERAAFLDGDVVITGKVTDGAFFIRIDNPLDLDRFLVHAGVVSSEMKSVYDGTVVLDGDGRATVELPEWFESLNESFRYQLTAVGAAAPDLHISDALADRTFAIAGAGPASRSAGRSPASAATHGPRPTR